MPDKTKTLLTRRQFFTKTACLSALTVTGCAGGNAPNFYSQDQQIQLGNKAWQDLMKEAKISRNTAAKNQVNRVMQRLLAQVQTPYQWQVAVIADDNVNAFALPGGKVGVYEGLVKLTNGNDAMLSSVLAHEVSHVLAEHSAKRMSTAQATSIGTTLLGVGLAAAGIGYGQQISSLVGLGAQYGLLLPFSREQEYEADRLGVQLMARAGYNPRAAVDFWRLMIAQKKGRGGPEFASTHPADQKRIAALEATIRQL